MELSPTADIYLLNPSHPETTMCWNPREDMSAFKDLLETKLGSLISTNVTFSCVLYKPNEPQAVTLECTFAAIFRLVSLIFIRQFKAIFITLDYRRKQLRCSTIFFVSHQEAQIEESRFLFVEHLKIFEGRGYLLQKHHMDFQGTASFSTQIWM